MMTIDQATQNRADRLREIVASHVAAEANGRGMRGPFKIELRGESDWDEVAAADTWAEVSQLIETQPEPMRAAMRVKLPGGVIARRAE